MKPRFPPEYLHEPYTWNDFERDSKPNPSLQDIVVKGCRASIYVGAAGMMSALGVSIITDSEPDIYRFMAASYCFWMATSSLYLSYFSLQR